MRLRKDAKLEHIRRVPLFSQLGGRELEEVGKIADEIDFEPGKVLTQQGTSGREFFILLEGSADVEKDGERIRTLGDGDFFGEISLIKKMPRTATVTTTSNVHAVVITERSFRTLLERSPEIQLKVLQALADRLEPSTP